MILLLGLLQLRIGLSGLVLVGLYYRRVLYWYRLLVPQWILTLFPVAVEGFFIRRCGDLTPHQWFCGGHPSQPAQLMLNCGCVGLFFAGKVTSLNTSNIVILSGACARSSYPGPCYCPWTGGYKVTRYKM